MKETNPYQEALRYMQNAKIYLKQADKKGSDYQDEKYVRTASGVAYNGVLLALDEYLKQKEGLKYEKPNSIEEYMTRVSKQNKSLKNLLKLTYITLHIDGYYHGATNVKLINIGMENAYKIIDYIK
jgi:hypothetical protein